MIDSLGVGIGWRHDIDLTVERMPGVDFVEVIADYLDPRRLPESLRKLRSRGVPVLPHAIGLSLGGAERPDPSRLDHLARLAEAVGAPLVSDHVAFVRSGAVEAGHLLPVPLTLDALHVLTENVRIAQDCLPVPLAIENIAALITWPDNEMDEWAFLAELVERTGVHLILDVENLYANWINFGRDPMTAIERLPLERIGYVHVAGGVMRDGVWHDTHAHPVPEPVWELLAALVERTTIPAALLERDARFPKTAELMAEVARIRATIQVTSHV